MPDVPPRRTCGAFDYHLKMLRTNPSYALARQGIEAHASDFARMGRFAARQGITTIPVVVHIVYNTAQQNISDQQVSSQIDVLNHDYRMTNPDAATAPGVFKAFQADARIVFVLASTDPSGAVTNGITRTQTSIATFSDDNSVKFTAQGGEDAWDATRYLNLWVCNLGGGLLGYAQFPGGPAATDGVVINYSAFGTNGTATAPFNLGRTATHEIGHWLDLHHIWGDKTDCTGDDLVADTPLQGAPNYNVPVFPHTSCNNGPNGDMFMNYMDYVDDNAMVMFTAGQVVRMQAALDGARSTIGAAAFAAKVDMTTQSVLTVNAQFHPGQGMTYNSQYGGWMLLGPGSTFETEFSLPVAPAQGMSLSLLHCTSALWPADGYAPVNIDANGATIKASYDTAAAHQGHGDTRGYFNDVFAIPKANLRAGANSLRITLQPGARSHYWVRNLQVHA